LDTAYFVRRPRTLEDLRRPHLLGAERPYEIVSQVALSAVDYENFVTDLLADRAFLEPAAALCAAGETMKCLLVRRRKNPSGILVVPERRSFVAWAAYREE